ncbi:hypothetical protein KJQ85_08925, partial [Campylobacter lari]|nr:hypothetical protein [Campylobacter lari]
FNTKATNNTPDPLKHRNFLKALDIIGQNNIKALYAGVKKDKDEKELKIKNRNNSDDERYISENKNKENSKPPKMIGRLATTIIMKNGLCIG